MGGDSRTSAVATDRGGGQRGGDSRGRTGSAGPVIEYGQTVCQASEYDRQPQIMPSHFSYILMNHAPPIPDDPTSLPVLSQKMHVTLQHLHLTAENIPSKARYIDTQTGGRKSMQAVRGRQALREYVKGGAGMALSMTQRVTPLKKEGDEDIPDNQRDVQRSKFVTVVYYKSEEQFTASGVRTGGAETVHRTRKQRSVSA